MNRYHVASHRSGTASSFGSVGKGIVSQGLLWFAFGCSKNHLLAADLPSIGNLLTVSSTASSTQLSLTESLYEHEISLLDDADAITSDMTPYESRKKLFSWNDADFAAPSTLLIERVSSLYEGVRSESLRKRLDDDMMRLMENDTVHVVMTDILSARSCGLLGMIAERCGGRVAMGRMTSLYSHIVFCDDSAADLRGSWNAQARLNGETFRYSMRNRLPANAGGKRKASNGIR